MIRFCFCYEIVHDSFLNSFELGVFFIFFFIRKLALKKRKRKKERMKKFWGGGCDVMRYIVKRRVD